MSLTAAGKVVHRFLRQPNHASCETSRIANRYAPFSNTLTHLQDPQSNRELFLIGTTNSSTTLAHRTRKLIEEVKPTSLYVQTTENWWNYAKHSQVFVTLLRPLTKNCSGKWARTSQENTINILTTWEAFCGDLDILCGDIKLTSCSISPAISPHSPQDSKLSWQSKQQRKPTLRFCSVASNTTPSQSRLWEQRPTCTHIQLYGNLDFC